jgi:hypothetical protein
MEHSGAQYALECNLFLSCKPAFCKIDKKQVENDALYDFDGEQEPTQEETLKCTGSILVKYSHRRYNYKREQPTIRTNTQKIPKIVWKLPEKKEKNYFVGENF